MTDVTIWIDADACPVREETYKVALRHEVPVKVVANNFLRVLEHPLIERGPKPFTHADRSKFLQSLHNVIEKLKRL